MYIMFNTQNLNATDLVTFPPGWRDAFGTAAGREPERGRGSCETGGNSPVEIEDDIARLR